MAAGIVALVSSGDLDHSRHLDVRAIPGKGEGPGAAESSLEELFGPDTPILTAGRGKIHGAGNR
jgi:hypothetical protein